MLELVQNFQRGLVEYEKGCIRQSSVEISVLQAEISHLSNGPMKEARNALEKLYVLLRVAVYLQRAESVN